MLRWSGHKLCPSEGALTSALTAWELGDIRWILFMVLLSVG